MERRNKEIYESKVTADHLGARVGLQKPEETILHLLQAVLKGGRVLDIGVGGGRTTLYLSAVAREYVGIDWSESLIAVCKAKFRDLRGPISFMVCDVRDMSRFAHHTFDVAMFSYNGIDCISHKDRLVALREIRRVLKPRGWLVFSTHNLQSAPKLFTYLPMRLPPWRSLSELLDSARVILGNNLRRMLNPNFRQLMKKKHAVFKNGAYKFGLLASYIDPSHQIEQLYSTGYVNIRIFSLADGTEIKGPRQLAKNLDPWLYFLCQAAA